MIFMRYPQPNTQVPSCTCCWLSKNLSNNTSQVYLYQIFVKHIHRNGPCIAFWPILSLRDILNEMEWAWIKILLSPDVSVCAKHFVQKCEKIHQCLVGIWKCRSLMLRTAYLSMCSAVFTASSVKIHLLLPCLHNIHKQDASRTEISFNTVKYFKEKMHRYDSSCDHHICFDFSTAPVFFRFSFHFSAITLKLQWPSGYRTQPIPSDFPTRMFSSGESSTFLFHFYSTEIKTLSATFFFIMKIQFDI